MRRDISRSIHLQNMNPVDSACAGINTSGMWAMREALKRWERKQGIAPFQFGRGKAVTGPPKPKPEPAPKPKTVRPPKPKIKTERKPRKPWRKYDPAIPRHKRPNWIAYRKKYVAEHPLTPEQKRIRAERCKAYRAKYSPEKKAAEVARVTAWKLARKQS